MTPAGAIALLLLGSGLATALATPPGAQADAPPALSVRSAPEVAPPQPEPTVPEQSGGAGAVAGQDAGAEPGDGEEDGDPLAVSITRLSPSTLPRDGRVTIGGRITNVSQDTWSELSVYAASSATPITTEEELLAAEEGAAGVEPADYQRLVAPGLFVRVPDLAPGESAPYRLSIPRGRLGIPAAPGVYRLGVQVLGTEEEGRVDGADGRARVLVAAVDPDQPPTEVALALQLRKRTVRTPTGAVDHVAGWSRTLGRTGRLRQLVGLLNSAGGYPVGVVLDPAVVEAAGSLAEGNGGTDLRDAAIDGAEQVIGTTDDPASGGAAAGAEAAPQDAEGTSEPSPEEAAAARAAASWLPELQRALVGRDVRAVPYGDLDLAAAAEHGDADLIGSSLTAGISMLAAYGIEASGVLAPYQGLLSQAAAEDAPPGVPALVAGESFVAATIQRGGTEVLDSPATDVPAVLTGPTGTRLLTYRPIRTRSGTAAGAAALDMRQRVLARAAIHATTEPGEPLVVVLPPQWSPGTAWRAGSFFAGLRRAPWVRPTAMGDLTPDPMRVVADEPSPEDRSSRPAPTRAVALRYPPRRLAQRLPVQPFRAAERLAAAGTVLGQLVADNDTLGPRVQRQALLGLSFHTRGRVSGMTGRLRAAQNVVTGWLREVELRTPTFVRMSSESGSFLVPVTNQLDVPVRVRLRPEVLGAGLRLEVPEAVVVEPGTRQPIRVAAQSSSIGVRSVRVDLVTAGGERLYPGPRFSIRSSQVARWVWVAMAVGSALLFVAIVVRIVRRVRARRSTRGPVMSRDGA